MIEDIINSSVVERNYLDLCAKVASVFNLKVMKSPYYSWVDNPMEEWFSRIYNLNIPNKNTNDIIIDLVKKIESGIIPKFITTGSTSKSDNIDPYLLKNGFKMFYEQTGMAINLDLLTDNNQNEYELKTITDEEDLFNWVLATNEIFSNKRDFKFYQKLLHEDDITFYAGYENGKIISTTMMFLSSGIAGLHLVGTIKEYRGRGLGTIMTKNALYNAKLKGCKFCVLQASEMGKRVYSKVGFTEYCKVRHWEYNKTSSYDIQERDI